MTLPGHAPVALVPLPGESLTGYVQRFNATGLIPALAVPAHYWDADLPAALAAAVQAATGLSPSQVRQMTMASWPLALRGRRAQRRHGWALHRRDVWLCPTCTPLSGYRALRWRLALAPVCLRCHTVLTHEKRFEPARPATSHELAVVRCLDELTTRALHGSPTTRAHLSLLRRICAAASATGGPPPGVPLGHMPSSEDLTWGPHPPNDPTAVLARLATLGLVLDSEASARRQWNRLHYETSMPQSPALAPAPQEATTRKPGATAPARARARRHSLLSQLAELSTSTGLRPENIPTLFNPWRSSRWPRLVDLEDQGFEALALHTLLLEALGAEARGSVTFVAHGIPAVVNQHDLLTRVRTREALTEIQCDRILAHAHGLVAAGLVDYAYRRGVLMAAPSLPRIPVVRLPRHPFWPTRTLVAAWSWLEYARSLPDVGPVPQVSVEALDRFRAELDPEAHLRLIEAVDAHVHGEDWATIACAASHPSPITGTGQRRSA